MLGRFETFASKVKAILEQKAYHKGYSISKGDQGEELFKFVGRHFGGHPLGEIIYKCVRYRYGGEALDLEKIAAWAYLVWQGAESPKGREVGHPPSQEGSMRLTPMTEMTDFGEGLATEQAQRVKDFTERYRHRRWEMVAAEISTVTRMAYNGSSDRPKVWEADAVRLAALVAEESGEAMKEALNMTRTEDTLEGQVYTNKIGTLKRLHDELLQTASMAIIAASVIKSREK